MARDEDAPRRRRLLGATLGAFLVAILLLVLFILPAEYGFDPTGVGRLTGVARLNAPGAPSGGNGTENVTTTFVYQATWPVSHLQVASTSGYLKDGAKRVLQFPLQVPNVTRVTASLRWTDANQTGGQPTEPDIFEVQVLSPNGRAGPATIGRNAQPGGSGIVNASLDYWTAPPRLEIEAESARAALEEVLRDFPEDRAGFGTWRVNVTLVHAGGSNAGGVPLQAGAVDDGNDWTLTLIVESYRLDAEALQSAVVRSDTTTITLAPGRGVEYKLHVNASQSFEYSWSAGNASLYFDFHGERDGGAATSHKQGTAARDSGEFTAPFTGRHGWYFENQGRSTVSIQMRTKGVYTVLGVV